MSFEEAHGSAIPECAAQRAATALCRPSEALVADFEWSCSPRQTRDSGAVEKVVNFLVAAGSSAFMDKYIGFDIDSKKTEAVK